MTCVATSLTQLTVGIADCIVSRDSGAVIVTYALGSCIAVTIYDPVAHVGGMLHFMLPEFKPESTRGQSNLLMFADTGIPILVKRAQELGASKHRLIVCAAGGAQVLSGGEMFSIGKRNHIGLRKTLWKMGHMIHAEHTGGTTSRSLRLEIGTGRLVVREGIQVEHELHAPGRLQKGVQI